MDTLISSLRKTVRGITLPLDIWTTEGRVILIEAILVIETGVSPLKHP